MKPVLILLNPPAPRPTMRDYYCSSTSKAGYVWQPIDLLVQSGYLDAAFDLKLLDAAAQRLSVGATLAAVAALRPAVVFSLVGTAAYPGDLEFLEAIHRRTGARIFVSGDLARFDPFTLLAQRPFLEGVVLDFTAPGLRDYLVDGRADPRSLAVQGEAARELPVARGEFSYPLPRHDLFLALPYRMSFLGRGFASVLTSYGCPFRCGFCNSCAIGFARRNPDDLFTELDALHARGVRRLFVKDFTFNFPSGRARMILGGWQEKRYEFRWIGYFRPERIDAELAALLRQTGCVMAQLGIETTSPAVLAAVKGEADLAAAERGIAALRAAGVPCGAHFIVDLPGDDGAGLRRTVGWAVRQGLAYASFNAFTPRPGSALAGPGRVASMDPSRPATGETARRVRWATRRFYLRPGFFVSAWRAARRGGGIGPAARMGLFLLRAMWGGGP